MKVRPKRKPIQWPDGARGADPCVAFVRPEDLGGPKTQQHQQRCGFPNNALTGDDLGAITDREFGERVGFTARNLRVGAVARTTFFPTGVTVELSEIFKEAVEMGHEVGTET